ncbi:MAG TPA: hypothetical protein VHC18_22280 [Amycolatopsis sp.]|nr:hypothetical protein [Amycolatopsis sp.]
MRIKITVAVLLLGGVTACGQVTPGTPVIPAPPPATPSSAAPVTTTTPPPSTGATTTKPPSTTKRSTSRKTTTARMPPTAGYQCRDGDEKLYEVCAGHKAWIDGQLECTNCLDSGGTWNIELQRCDYPSTSTTTTSR